MSSSITIYGNVSKMKDLEFLDSGVARLSVQVAVSLRGRQNSDGKWDNPTQFYTVTVWGKQAETIADTWNVGDQVMAVGVDPVSSPYIRNDGTAAANIAFSASHIQREKRRKVLLRLTSQISHASNNLRNLTAANLSSRLNQMIVGSTMTMLMIFRFN
ncbi:MAG: single-stranded DNA-binding protein [Saprospiraceae bacterium]|nr:single-stranded DNA-binding protein [Saprospiraceae bacterium]